MLAGASLIYSTDIQPDDAAPMLRAALTGALQELKRQLES
jgi:hypothetical protein